MVKVMKNTLIFAMETYHKSMIDEKFIMERYRNYKKKEKINQLY